MKQSPIVLVLGVAAALPAQAPDVVGRSDLPPGAPPGTETILGAELQQHAEWLAADARRGRLTATPGQVETARYVAEHFESLGLEPLGDEEDGGRGFFQGYPVTKTFLHPEGTRVVVGGTEIEHFAVMPSDVPQRVSVEGTWVQVRPRDEVEDLEGKIPVVVLETPRLETRRIEVLFSSAMLPLRISSSTAKKLERKGARAVVFALLDDEGGVPVMLNYAGLAPGKPLLAHAGDRGMAAMARMFDAPIPRVFLPAAESRLLLARLGTDAPADATRPPERAGGQPVAGRVALDVRREGDARAVNVVAALRGSDPELRQEAVVYSAHMDHVGVRMDGDVFNGADDNASGTAGLLEVAEAFARAPEPPRRSVVFLSVSGEELGLWGSHWYSEHPTWPADDIVANVNIDMIGRSGPESGPREVTVTPSYHNDAFSTLVQEAARCADALGIAFLDGDKYWTRSDHYNFARLGIPAVFFCNGEHEDYHQVTDHPELLDAAKMQRLARLAYWVGHEIAQQDARPEILGKSDGWRGQR